jgi:hypothetical protein
MMKSTLNIPISIEHILNPTSSHITSIVQLKIRTENKKARYNCSIIFGILKSLTQISSGMTCLKNIDNKPKNIPTSAKERIVCTNM